MFTTRHTRTLALSFVAVGVAAAGGLVGCSNGLVTSSEPGQAPSLDTPSATAPASPSVEPTPSTPTTDPSPTADPADPSPAPTSSGGDDREPRHSTDPPSRQGGGSSSSTTEPSSTGSSGGSTSGGSGGSASGSSVASCTTADLDLGVERADGGGAAGSSYVVITYANSSDQPCSLRGYAGVSFVGHGDGTQLGAAAERVPGEVKTITLIPNDHDSELVQIANAGNFEDSECAPTTADGLRIYPPGSTEAVYVPFEFQACQGDGVQQLQVSPVGTSG